MFVGIARLTFSIPGAASLKDKRQVLRKLLDRTRAKFNVAAAEVGDNDLWQKAVVGLSVIGNDRRFVQESLDTILHFIDELYLAPMLDRAVEIIALGDVSYGQDSVGRGTISLDSGTRTLAEAEGLVPPEDGWDDGGLPSEGPEPQQGAPSGRRSRRR